MYDIALAIDNESYEEMLSNNGYEETKATLRTENTIYAMLFSPSSILKEDKKCNKLSDKVSEIDCFPRYLLELVLKDNSKVSFNNFLSQLPIKRLKDPSNNELKFLQHLNENYYKYTIISFDVYKNIKDNQYYLTLHILYSLPAEDNSYDIIYRNTQVLAYFKLEEEDVNKNDKEEPVSLYGYTYKFESASILYGEN